ncbi:MAG: type II toxin-antitoxin system PemK/MazF family toxin [Gemmatimonadales bacterium]
MDVVSADHVARGDVFLVALDPTLGREIRKTRPCVIVSPDELNAALSTFIIAPLTTGSHRYPFRIPCRFAGKAGQVVLDQLRTVDRARLTKRIGRISPGRLERLLSVLQEMFAP